MADKKAATELSFEQALERLEKIVTELEEGELPLEKTIERFTEGMKLAGICTGKLGDAQQKVECLLRNGNGAGEWAEFEPGSRSDRENAD